MGSSEGIARRASMGSSEGIASCTYVPPSDPTEDCSLHRPGPGPCFAGPPPHAVSAPESACLIALLPFLFHRYFGHQPFSTLGKSYGEGSASARVCWQRRVRKWHGRAAFHTMQPYDGIPSDGIWGQRGVC